MTKGEFEIKLIEDLVKGIPYIYPYIIENLAILRNNKDYFREYFLNDPVYSYHYAIYIDKCPRDDTRKVSCKNPYYAYTYAKDVDKCPRDDTRKVACKDTKNAYWYAYVVDKCPRDDTFNSVKGTNYEKRYLRNIGNPIDNLGFSSYYIIYRRFSNENNKRDCGRYAWAGQFGYS